MATFGKTEGEGTVIGTHVKLTGILQDPNDITVLGKLEGEVHSDHTVTVGEHAQVKGPVSAARAIIAGSVKGNIHTKDRLEILPRGSVVGNIETRDLVIHSGATFNGRCEISGGEVHAMEEAETPIPPAERGKTEEQPRRLWPPIRLARQANVPKPTEPKRAEEQQPPDQAQDEKPTYEVE